jgi:hypothetical protein
MTGHILVAPFSGYSERIPLFSLILPDPGDSLSPIPDLGFITSVQERIPFRDAGRVANGCRHRQCIRTSGDELLTSSIEPVNKFSDSLLE